MALPIIAIAYVAVPVISFAAGALSVRAAELLKEWEIRDTARRAVRKFLEMQGEEVHGIYIEETTDFGECRETKFGVYDSCDWLGATRTIRYVVKDELSPIQVR